MDKIAVDAMGGDFAPLEIVKGAVLAVRDFHVPVVPVSYTHLTLPTNSLV